MSWYLTIAFQKSSLQLLIDKMSPNVSVCMQEPERCRLPAALWSSVTFTLVNDATSILVQADAVLDALLFFIVVVACWCHRRYCASVWVFCFVLQQLSSASYKMLQHTKKSGEISFYINAIKLTWIGWKVLSSLTLNWQLSGAVNYF